jgi:hypothetical protein
MVRRSDGWSLTLDDPTSDLAVTKLIPYGVGAAFTAAEWIQEDPTADSVTAVDLPYPEMSTVVFQGVTVNGAAPHLTLDEGQTLSAADGIFLVPSPLHDDAVSLSVPTGVAAQYLHDASKLDAALSAFNVEFSSWSSTSTATRTLDVDTLEHAYKANATAFTSQTWPAAARSDIALLAAQLLRTVGDLQAWTASGLEPDGPAFLTLRSDQEIAPLADEVRATLGLPPP